MRRLLESVKYFGLRKLYYLVKSGIASLSEFLVNEGISRKEWQQSLVKRQISKTLITDYGGDEGHNSNTTQYFLGFGLIHYALVRNSRPKRILCVGSRKGFIPAILALACKDNGVGHVGFVDAGYGPEEPTKHWSGVRFWKHMDPAKHFGKLGVSSYITTHVMTTKEFARRFPDITYQYIYIDGDHSYEGVKLDYELFWPKLDRHGCMVFHDVVARGRLDQGKFGIWRFWQELSTHSKIIFPFPKESGLGILQKP
ncbi:class I SAM-dependent methyltransferase [Patescibacteria group bacterium]|nr:class I SAM-dependent methyltransferase [Patescibacteria group bacterium]MBU1472494.1 class I SAM-dependent methyltransferase [Patescibacteria group bacterium]MBU2459549.1 class I SAM-dependent methyltransferase [Patescibacteria group bacterium]MBU2543862.1 class I SAM-dependent methyltransferase [Patescibacteria group bacterium]